MRAKSANIQPLDQATDASATAVSNHDNATTQAIQQARNEHGTRAKPPKIITEPPLLLEDLEPSPKSTTTPKSTTPKSAIAKKRPAAKNHTAKATPSKGARTGTKKPPPKKRKTATDDEAKDPAEPAQPVSTPLVSSRRGSKTSTASQLRKASQSATPARSSPLANPASHTPSNVGSEDEDGEVYCICRKPDNHQWMIGCDGPCEDWFHGKCVNLQRDDEDLLDKYICPGCEERGVGVTTWKPMCRHDGCRRPARLKKGAESKYCSDECGIQFMKEVLGRSGALNYKPFKKKGANNKSNSKRNLQLEREEDGSDASDTDIGPLGGPIRAHELKALVHAASNIDHFRGLGSAAMLTPLATATLSPEQPSHMKLEQPFGSSDEMFSDTTEFTQTEQSRLEEILQLKDRLRRRRALLKEREKFVVMAKERAARISGGVCGFDGRLAWDDDEFQEWRDSEEGKSCYARESLDYEGSADAASAQGKGNGGKKKPAGVTKPKPKAKIAQRRGTNESEINDHEEEGEGIVCRKKRCQRHSTWQKLAYQDVRFEEIDVGEEFRKVDGEESEIRTNARERERRQGAAGNGEGQVEVVEDGEEGDAGEVMVNVPAVNGVVEVGG